MLTPKEKRKELIEKMYNVQDPMNGYPMCFDTAKQCALIAVDEILKSNPTTFYEEIIENIGYTAMRECNSNYWQEVKQEIEKL
jgi:hypothetical protein